MTQTHYALTIKHIKKAITTANISIGLGLLAILVFGVFGTLASMAAFKDSLVIYYMFHYLPYLLIALSIPFSLYHLFLLTRYRIIQFGMIVILLATGIGLLMISGVFLIRQGASVAFFMSLFLAMIAWFGMPFLFKVSFKKFLNFLQENHQSQ